MLVSNATLTQINSATAGVDDYDGPVPVVSKWTGTVDAYLETTSSRIQTPAGSEYERRWTVYLQRGTPPVDINIGDTLLLQRTRPDSSIATLTLPVLSVADRYEPDMPADVQTLAIIVEPTSPEAPET